jgi:hypothetical protein
MISAIQEACKVYGVNPTPENSLACLMCKDPWVAEYVSRVGTGWMILQVTHQSGITYWVAACLKPANWTKLRKDQGMSNECEKVLYSYSDDGIFGYRRNTLEEAVAFATEMDRLYRRDRFEEEFISGKNIVLKEMKRKIEAAGFSVEDFGQKLNPTRVASRQCKRKKRADGETGPVKFYPDASDGRSKAARTKRNVSQQNTPEVQE